METLKTLNNAEGGATLLSSITELDLDKHLTVLIGGQDMAIYNDTVEFFSIDAEFITENVVYTLESYKRAGSKLSALWIDAIQACYEEPGNSNYVHITSEVIMNSVHNGKIVKREMAQIFGLFLGVYIAGRCGYSKIAIDTVDAFLHPARQRHIVQQLQKFSVYLSQLAREKQAQDRTTNW